MTHTHTGNHAQANSQSAVPVVLFGVDDTGKPKAARFGKEQADLAIKAAAQLQLRSLAVTSPDVAEVARRLPVGRIHGNGRNIVPNVSRDLYEQLLALAEPAASLTQASSPAASASAATEAAAPTSNETLPRHWDEISRGHLVIAQEAPAEGWYEAIVDDQTADMLTLRWRDYPREQRVMRHRNRVGLLYPNGQGVQPNGITPTEAKKQRKPNAPGAATPVPASALNTGAYPVTWNDIAVDQLVLAKQDGPWGTWWEAIVVQRADDMLTLQWRDYPKIAPAVRPRLAVALLHVIT